MKIFISYRRDDSAGYAGRLFDFLTARFGVDNVFMDIDTIKPGEDFRKVIAKAVGTCDVVLVLMGKHWLSMVDAEGHRRLDDPLDWVRVEIATALANPRIRVIPVLVHNGHMPGDHELPEELKELIWRNAIDLSDSRFQHDTKKLIQTIEGEKRGLPAIITARPFVEGHRQTRWRFPWWVAILMAVLGILYFTFPYFPRLWQSPLPLDTVGPTHTAVTATSTVEPIHTSTESISTASPTVTTSIAPAVQSSTPLPVNNITQPLPATTIISAAVPVEPTSIPPATTTDTAVPNPTITLFEISGCPELLPDAPYPTPFAQQIPSPSTDNYLAYDSNFEVLRPMTEPRTQDWAEYYLYWNVSNDFKSRLDESHNYTTLNFIVPDNRQPPEGNYSICIEAPPSPIAPAEFRTVTQTLPADELLRLSFFYKTSGSPDFRVHLTAGGSYVGPFLTADGHSDAMPQPLALSDNNWTKEFIDFRVVENDGTCPFGERWGNRPTGCFNLRFMVEGTGNVWLDDIWVGRSP